MEKGDLTYLINGCAMTVHKKLRYGCLEYVYCRALAIELRQAGIAFQREVWLPIYYGNFKIADRRVDFLCEGLITVEIKAKTEFFERKKQNKISNPKMFLVKELLNISPPECIFFR